MTNKYSAFITEISEILGLGKPVDILKLCATTDLFFQPLEKRIAELEKENAELKKELVEKRQLLDLTEREWGKDMSKMIHYKTQSTKAKDHVKKLLDCLKQDINDPQTNYYVCQYMDKAEQFIKEIE